MLMIDGCYFTGHKVSPVKPKEEAPGTSFTIVTLHRTTRIRKSVIHTYITLTFYLQWVAGEVFAWLTRVPEPERL